MEETTPKKRGQKLKAETVIAQQEKQAKETERQDNNLQLDEANRQLEVITQKFVADPEPFFAERKKEIAKTIEKYGDLQNQDLQEGIMTKKDYSLRLTNALCKPFIPKSGFAKMHTATTLALTSDFYWNEIVTPLNDKGAFIPNIYHIFSLLNISKSSFDDYMNNGQEDMRETCNMIKDRFIAYYQQRGMEKAVSEIMAMFVLKTTFQQRENDVPQVVIQNNNISNDEKIREYARKHNYEVWLPEE